MLDVKDSLSRLRWTVDHHFLHIQARHDFMRAWAIQFELAYTDFRTIQLALQLSGEENHPLLASFAAAYEAVYQYEYAFATEGLAGFDDKFSGQMEKYEQAVKQIDGVLDQIEKLQG